MAFEAVGAPGQHEAQFASAGIEEHEDRSIPAIPEWIQDSLRARSRLWRHAHLHREAG
jgi:hypothetical protein